VDDQFVKEILRGNAAETRVAKGEVAVYVLDDGELLVCV
jgi:hypothetical protein